jgi:hypothetical protein
MEMPTNTLQKNPHQVKMTKNPLIRRSFEHVKIESKKSIHKNIKVTPSHGCEKQGKINKKHNHF